MIIETNILKSVFFNNMRNQGNSNSFLQYSRHPKYEKQLELLMHSAAQGEISIDELRRKGKTLEEEVGEEVEKYLLLKDAFGFLDDLHDSTSREELTRALIEYCEILSGKREKAFFFKPEPNVQIKVTYERIE